MILSREVHPENIATTHYFVQVKPSIHLHSGGSDV